MLRKILSSVVLMASLAGAALAQSPEDQIIDSLQSQGFHVVSRDKTWLGRIWLLVENGEVRREIVFNPSTGEIMRDYTVQLAVREPGRSKSQGGTGKGGPLQEIDILKDDAPIDTIVVGDPLTVAPSPVAK